MNDIDKIAALEKSLWDSAASLPLGSKELEAANRKASRVGLAADLAIDAERHGRVVDFRVVMHEQEGHPRLGAREWWGERPLDATITPLEIVQMVADSKLDCWSAREWLSVARNRPRRSYPRNPEPAPCPQCGGECRTVGLPVGDRDGNQSDMVETVSECQSCGDAHR